MKKILVSLLVALMLFGLAACSEDITLPFTTTNGVVTTTVTGTTTTQSGTATTQATTTTGLTSVPTSPATTTPEVTLPFIESDTGLDPNVSGIIDIVLWSGSGQTLYDMGKQNYTPSQLLSMNEAGAYAVAKAFNQLYPNVVINGYFKPDDPGAQWNQILENYRDAEGRFPALWASVQLPDDVSRGIVADLSRFQDDPLYKALNPQLMAMMNYYGFQAGLPQYILPWGVFINKSLADSKGIEVPGYDWHVDDYTEFTSHYSNDSADQFYGAMDTPRSFIDTGTTTIAASLSSYAGGDTFVNLNSTQVRNMLSYIPQWVDGSLYGQAEMETAAEIEDGPVNTFLSNGGWWGFSFFRQNRLLTLDADPWMMGACAEADESWPTRCNIADWDIYPRPATDYQDTTIGIVLDPLAVYNYCLDDGDISCTPEEELKIQIAYTFAIFWTADSRAIEARANQLYYDPRSESSFSSAIMDSLPVTTGDLFYAQMDYWYSPTKHQRFGAKVDGEWLMPGFQEVLRLYESGQFWDVSDKSFPWHFSFEGTRSNIMTEWFNYYNPLGDGSKRRFDTDFVSVVQSLLPEWNTIINQRFADAFARLRAGLKMYYGYTDDDF